MPIPRLRPTGGLAGVTTLGLIGRSRLPDLTGFGLPASGTLRSTSPDGSSCALVGAGSSLSGSRTAHAAPAQTIEPTMPAATRSVRIVAPPASALNQNTVILLARLRALLA